MPLEGVECLLNEFERVKLLFRWTDAEGKTWGFWIGIDKPGRLPGKSRQGKNEPVGPTPPPDELRKFLDSNGFHRALNGNEKLLGLGSGLRAGTCSGASDSKERNPRIPSSKKQLEAGQKRQSPSNGALSQKEFSDAACRLFAERYQGKKPTWGRKHFVQLAELLSIKPDLTVEEFSERYKNFLGSPVLFHSQKRGSLAFFCPNFDEFIEPITTANPLGGRYVSKAEQRSAANRAACAEAFRMGEERNH
jgi:hypothetical protein